MSTNEIYNQMLSVYELTTEQQRRNAIFEVNQQVILAGLYNGGFFDEAAAPRCHPSATSTDQK